MKLLLDERNLIVAIGSDIAYGVWGNVKDMYSWRITKTSYMMDNNFRVVEVDSVPNNVHEGEYYYIDGEYVYNENCPDSYQKKYDDLEATVTDLASTQADILYEMSCSELGLDEITEE